MSQAGFPGQPLQDLRTMIGNVLLPEFTLWETFSEAVEVAFETAAECGVCIDMEEAEIDFSKGMCFLPEFCDIMPITISTKDRLTWLGKEWKKVLSSVLFTVDFLLCFILCILA